MQYVGKYMDTFEAAMQMLFLQKGYGKITHLDAMGRRCFAFCHGTDGYGWYLPVVGAERAVHDIAIQMKLENRLTAGRFPAMERLREEGGIVYGPVARAAVLQRPDIMYYHGENRFFYISREEGDVYAVTDPSGFPGVLCTEAELEEFFRVENGITVSLCENDGLQGQGADLKQIWSLGVAFHREMTGNAENSTLKKESLDAYVHLSSSRIALWYGVINFIQQTEKVFRLRTQVGGSGGSDRKLRELQSGMLKAVEEEKVYLLPETEQAIWKEIMDEI